MAESKGPPRKTTTYNRFSTMASQNQRYNTKQDEFYWLENIMRVAPHKLHSVPGPGAPHHFPIPGPTCIDTTLRGQQQLQILDYFLNNTEPNTRTSWGFMDDNETISTLVGSAICGGGNMTYDNTCCTVNNFVGGGAPASTSGLITPTTEPFINTRIGKSDRVCWGAISDAYNGLRLVFDNNLTVDYALVPNGFGGFNLETYTVKGNTVWTFQHVDVFSPPSTYLRQFDRVTGTLLNTYNPFGNDNVSPGGLQATDNFLYVIGINSTLSKVFVYKISQSDGSLVSSLDITALSGAQFVCVADDNLQYVLCGNSPASVYYITNFTDCVYVGYTPGQGFTPFGFGTGIWKNGGIYYGSNGFAGFSPDIFKIAVSCPPEGGAILVSITTAPTVSAGSSINVSWADVLVPNAADTILIKPAPAAEVFGLSGTTIASATNTGASTSGTVAITIPGGTTPGNYVAMYAALNAIWAATSAPFTVT